MGLEQRGNRKYYYRSRRIGGRVVKEYIGSGPVAEEAAKRDAEARKAEFRQWKKEYDEEVAELDRLDNLVNMILEAYMLNAGYHRPKRGRRWRKKRVPKQ